MSKPRRPTEAEIDAELVSLARRMPKRAAERCRQCRGRLGASLFVLTGGTLGFTDHAARMVMVNPGDVLGFFLLNRHETKGSWKRESWGAYVPAGLFEICFCSKACLRAFFSEHIGRGKRAKRAKLESPKKRRKQRLGT